MFSAGILIGVYSYCIYALGLVGLLYPHYIFFLTILFVALLFFFNNSLVITTLQRVAVNAKQTRRYWKKKLQFCLVSLLITQITINLIGALGPELGFDALWYHLTIPKIYLENHSIFYIPGGLFYYSAMPKLTEMLYLGGIAFGSEIVAKLVHFSFGILSLIALYNLSRKFLSKTFSFLVLVLFYSNLVVGWMSTTAYIDLARTFFEIMALWGFLEWQQTKKSKWLIESAVMLGLAVSTKFLAIGSLLIFSIILVYNFLDSRIRSPRWSFGEAGGNDKKDLADLFIGLFAYWIICLLIPLPGLIFSFINTGNPVFPFFSSIYPVKFNLSFINPLNLYDPISPFYVIFLPLALFLYRKFRPSLKVVSLYSFLAIVVWYLTPQTGGGRFILPYLPAFSIISVIIIGMIKKTSLRNVLIGSIVIFALFSIVYRFGANIKYIPVILGLESKSHFLTNNLNFSFGDFYDIDGYFKDNIKRTDKVLLYGFHNLYYVNFPFIDSSYVKKGDRFNYIAVQGANIPERFKFWNLIYYNSKTDTKLYSLGHSTVSSDLRFRDSDSRNRIGSDSKRGIKWAY